MYPVLWTDHVVLYKKSLQSKLEVVSNVSSFFFRHAHNNHIDAVFGN